MFDWLYESVNRIATWRLALLLAVVCAICILGFTWRNQKLNGHLALDGHQCGYTSDQAHAFLEVIGNGGRALYAGTQLTLDLVFPAAYGLLIAVLLTLFLKANGRYVIVLPAAVVLFDLLENLSTACLAIVFEKSWFPKLASAASFFTTTKWASARLCVVALTVSLLVWIVSLIRPTANP